MEAFEFTMEVMNFKNFKVYYNLKPFSTPPKKQELHIVNLNPNKIICQNNKKLIIY